MADLGSHRVLQQTLKSHLSLAFVKHLVQANWVIILCLFLEILKHFHNISRNIWMPESLHVFMNPPVAVGFSFSFFWLDWRASLSICSANITSWCAGNSLLPPFLFRYLVMVKKGRKQKLLQNDCKKRKNHSNKKRNQSWLR